MGLENEMLEIIKKNMPEHVGSELKKLIEKGERDAQMVKALKDDLTSTCEELKDCRKELESHVDLNKRFNYLESKEKELLDREIRLEIQKLTHELQCEKEKVEFSKGVALGLVRNLDYRSSAFGLDTGNTGEKDQYGNQIYRSLNTSSNVTNSIS
jgi:hypothetical protein